nr:hypothetical protein DM860_010446 [Ipomoea batatas]
MVVRRIELEKAVEELLEVVFGVDVLLQDHLEHGVPEIEVRVVGVFLNGDALAADSPEALHRPEALDFGIGVGGGVGRETSWWWCPFMAAPWFGVEDGGEFGPPAKNYRNLNFFLCELCIPQT